MGIHNPIENLCKSLQGELAEAFVQFVKTATLDTAAKVVTKAEQLAFHGEMFEACRSYLCEVKESVEHLNRELQRTLSLSKDYIRWSSLLNELAKILGKASQWRTATA